MRGQDGWWTGNWRYLNSEWGSLHILMSQHVSDLWDLVEGTSNLQSLLYFHIMLSSLPIKLFKILGFLVSGGTINTGWEVNVLSVILLTLPWSKQLFFPQLDTMLLLCPVLIWWAQRSNRLMLATVSSPCRNIKQDSWLGQTISLTREKADPSCLLQWMHWNY